MIDFGDVLKYIACTSWIAHLYKNDLNNIS